MIITSFVTFLLSSLLWAQIPPDGRGVEVRRQVAGHINLPVSIDDDGDIAIFGGGNSADLIMNPVFQLGFERSKILYVQPRDAQRLTFDKLEQDQKWVEYLTQNYEFGAGLRLSRVIRLGLVPYRGAYVSFARLKSHREERLSHALPKDLIEFQEWNPGDQGHYQVYGGVSLKGGGGVGDIIDVSVSYVLQNKFILSFSRLGNDSILLTVGEESSSNRMLRAGAEVVRTAVSRSKGKLFNADFILSISNPLHRILFQKVLEGKLDEVQMMLPNTSQQISWSARERSVYFGLPNLAGEQRSWSTFEYGASGEEVYIQTKKTKGLLTKFREHINYSFTGAESISLFWTSKMKRVDGRALWKRFLRRGQVLGVEGFDHEFPRKQVIGSVVSQLGLVLTRKDVETFRSFDRAFVREQMLKVCKKYELECRKTKRLNRVLGSFSLFVEEPWQEGRDKLGMLFLQEPALVHALLKDRRIEKKVFFKFLSDRFQSLVGLAPILI